MTAQSQRTKKQQRLVDEFNAKHPIGTPVRFWKGKREGKGVLSVTRSAAELLGGHTAVVWVECIGPCIALSHVEPLSAVEVP